MHALAVEAAGSEKAFTVEAVDLGGGAGHAFGYLFTISGTCTPDNYGNTIEQLYANDLGLSDFFLGISGTGKTADYIKRILVQDTSGTWRQYLPGTASYSDGGGMSTWRWGDGTNRAWTAAGTYRVIISTYRS